MKRKRSIHFDRRDSGIPVVGDVPWGTSFCQFFENRQDLLEILIPYIKAGLKSNELCLLIISGYLDLEEARQALEEAVPHFERYIKKGQIEIIAGMQRRMSGTGFTRALAARIDKAMISGFGSLRIAVISPSGNPGGKTAVTFREVDEIARHNIVALYAYPREELDAAELMEVVKRHRFALIRSNGDWELLESSEVNLTREALKKSELLYRSLFDNMLEGYAYCRMIYKNSRPHDFVFLAVNSSFEKQTGLKYVTGKRVSQVIPGIKESNPELFEIYGRVALTGKPERFEVYLAPLQSWYSVSVYSPVKGAFGAVFDNITERKKAEEELKQYSAELEASNRELESFSYSVSHDLRAPLRSIDGFSQAILEDYADKLDEQGQKWLGHIRSASQRMAQLIDDILGLSRVVRAELRAQDIDLSSMAEAVAGELKDNYPGRNIQVRITPGLKARGDANLLRIALGNLLDNAFKFTAGCEVAQVEFGSLEAGGQRYFFVKDNGAGFDMIYADKLFNAFHRLHGDEEYPGTGIGLATVQRIIHRHGGKVLARGEPGQGAIFLFTLNQDIK